MTDLPVTGLTEEQVPPDTGQVPAGVLVTTHDTFTGLLARRLVDLASCRLLVVDNCQQLLTSSATSSQGGALLRQYRSLPRNRAPRLVTITPNLLTTNTDTGLASLPRQLDRLEEEIPANVECACEVRNPITPVA